MISKYVERYCSEELNLIENYEKAVADKNVLWDCHHRLETTHNKSRSELKADGLYWKRPASELIFIPTDEHHRMHREIWRWSPEMKRHLSEKAKERLHDPKNHPLYREDIWKDEELIIERLKNGETCAAIGASYGASKKPIRRIRSLHIDEINAARSQKLKERDKEILALLERGLSSKKVARLLHCSQKHVLELT